MKLKVYGLALLFMCFSFISKAQKSLLENPLPDKYKSLEKYDSPVFYDYGKIKIYAISTGYISTSGNFPEPVFVWLIKTDTANYLIDAGLSSHVLNKNYFGGISGYFFEKQFTFYRTEKNDLIARLKELSVYPKNIKSIFLTHAHFDHIGYLPELKGVKVFLTEKEKDEVAEQGQLAGYQKNTDTIIDLKRIETIHVKEREIKKLNSLISIIRTGQHTPGHEMILLQGEKIKILFTGDLNLKMEKPNSDLMNFLDQKIGLKDCTQFFNHDINLK
ncbi:MAG TPA: MBL fold metallo-hydrolase [Bacteroidia bacterium]|jgi:glyoxylase-like metal-dependent hydrolase (beta-lactamase superfamily II)|nr:MBL fold metallo-hydrolase [Bacteroidia bacterium]